MGKEEERSLRERLHQKLFDAEAKSGAERIIFAARIDVHPATLSTLEQNPYQRSAKWYETQLAKLPEGDIDMTLSPTQEARLDAYRQRHREIRKRFAAREAARRKGNTPD